MLSNPFPKQSREERLPPDADDAALWAQSSGSMTMPVYARRV